MARVLLVEDDAAIAEAVRQALEAEDYDVVHASNGREGLNLLSKMSPPSVILLDLMMPVMTGWQFMAELSQQPRLASIPIVVTSATSAPEEHPGHDFLKKPYSLSDLLVLVEKHVASEPERAIVRAAG